MAQFFWPNCTAETVDLLIATQVTDLTFSNSLKGGKLRSVGS